MRRIKQISVTNLFGMFNYVIPLHLDERITIIHGPNGFGKTVILKLLSEIFSGIHLEFSDGYHPTLRTVPFEQFIIDFDDGISFQLTKSFQTYSRIVLNVHVEELLVPQITFQLVMPTVESTMLEAEYIGPYTWRYQPATPLDRTHQKEPEWLIEIRGAIFVHLIETQRLSSLIRSENAHEDNEMLLSELTVPLYSTELRETIKTKLAESVALAQSLDRTFPARVVSPRMRNNSMTDDELRQKLADLERKRSRLIATGLLDKEDDANFQVGDQIDEGAKTALAIYVEDTEKKLAVFDDIANKIELLTSIINKRFLFKHMEISKEDGFIFIVSNGTELPLESLSSGEQHELVLFYELLFKVYPGSLILIDEPELSLHVVWQEQFLRDIQEITRLSDIDVLLATHSPDIISDRRDLVVELEGPK